MNKIVFLWPSIYLCGLLLLGGCAAPGSSYEDVMANPLPAPNDAVRIIFLRPTDADDSSNGGGKQGKRCRGPYKRELLAEEDALLGLFDLTWSGD